MANYIDTDIELLNLWTALVSCNQPGHLFITCIIDLVLTQWLSND